MIDMIFNIGLYNYLCLSLFLFLVGFVGVIISKNIIKVLLCAEFMVGAVCINFCAFASFFDYIKLDGFIFSLFYIALAAVEVAIALAIFYMMFKSKHSADTEVYTDLRG